MAIGREKGKDSTQKKGKAGSWKKKDIGEEGREVEFEVTRVESQH